jgi:hypothetical protein
MRFNPLFIPIVFFVFACCLPALEFKGSDAAFGLRILVIGWSGLFAGVLAWYANPLWVLGLLFGALRKRIPAVLCGLLSLPIAMTVFSDLGRELPGDEGNVTKTAIVRLLPGGYVWLLSLVSLPLAALFRKANP